jgi:hypothetical protein
LKPLDEVVIFTHRVRTGEGKGTCRKADLPGIQIPGLTVSDPLQRLVHRVMLLQAGMARVRDMGRAKTTLHVTSDQKRCFGCSREKEEVTSIQA